MCFSTELEGGVPLVDPEGVVGRLQVWPIFVVDGAEGVVGALIVVVGLGSWLGGPGGSPKKKSISEIDFYLNTIIVKNRRFCVFIVSQAFTILINNDF